MTAYYNEFDPRAAAWLRMLIQDGLIAPGDVDERSIIDVKPEDLKGYTQHHFFAGIGVWSYALRNAGWSDDIRVCTASLPCQPFSAAGKQKGKEDERHLLPHFLDLVRECGFNTIFGEQVESAIRHGWLDDLQTSMEAEGYAIGHAVLGAHSAGSFHQRQRLYWVAQRVGNTQHNGQPASPITGSHAETVCNGTTRQNSASEFERASPPGIISGEFGGLGYTGDNGYVTDQVGRKIGTSEAESRVLQPERPDTDIEWLYCRDGKYRAIKSGLKPLVDGSATGVGYSGDPSQPIDADYSAEARVMRLKGYGNAIHAGTAEMFIRAFMECRP